MQYLVTWSEGEEVAYLILGEQDLCRLGMDDKNYIITEFSTH
ncbi:MAG: hypothetical protein ACOX2P_01070 [Bacillota bacterium]|jgi:hypothetical protein